MKKIIAISIAILMLLNICPVMAEQTHWANEEIQYLLDKNVIEGDDRGVRPDEFITRAEFAKVLNKNMGYNDTTGEAFIDVNVNDWYYEDMLIAKNVGYFKGDDNGYSNPNNNLSRMEACVVYARLLNLSLDAEEFSFKDNDKIQHWAKPYVNTLVKSRIIVGYGDGEFKPNNFMTRAEVFSTVVRVENYSYDNKEGNNPSNNDNNNYIPPTYGGGGSSSSGGGGGGGGNSTSKSPTISKVDTKTKTVYWNLISGTSSYCLKIKKISSGAIKDVIGIKTNSYKIDKEIEELLGTDKQAIEKFSVCVSKDGNVFSREVQFQMEYETVPQVENLNVGFEIDEGTQLSKITWNVVDTAKEYEVIITVDNNENKFISTTNELILPTNMFLTGKHTVKIKTISNSSDYANSLPKEVELEFPLFGGGTGDAQTPYLIYRQEQFMNISLDSTKAFLLKNDIVLTDYEPMNMFKGLLDGGNNSVNYIFNNPDKETIGLFKTLDAGEIKNLEVTGSIIAKNFVGAICANSANNAKITNCINSMTIEVADPLSKWCGGIVGDAKMTNITNCVNKGELKFSGSMVGGIVGYLQSTSTINGAANLGTIAGLNNVGGIVGASYGKVENVYNKGNITGNSVVGGLVGFARPVTGYIKYGFNTGDILANIKSAGIIANIDPSGTIELDELYNIGDIYSKSNDAGAIYCYKTSGTIGDKVYYSNNSYYDLELANTFKKTDLEMKNLDFSSDKWVKSGTYLYPQLSLIAYNGEYEEKLPTLEKPTANVFYNGTNVNVTIAPVANAVTYKIVVVDLNKNETEFETNNVIDVISAMPEFGEYTLYLTSLADNVNYRNSSRNIINFTHKELGQLETPKNLKNIWVEDNGVETFKVTWDEVLLSESYNITVYDGSNNEILTSNVSNNEFKLVEGSGITFGVDYRVSVTAIATNEKNNSLTSEITFSTLFANGNGTESTPYVIKNLRHLNLMISRNDVMFYSLEGNITLPNDYTPMVEFKGTLIGAIVEGNRPYIDFGTRTGLATFGFIGTLKGKVSNIEFRGNLSGTTKIGIVAHEINSATAIIDNCLSKVSINATDTGTAGYVGGIIGRMVQGTILNSRNEGSIITKGRHTGGIVGRIWGGSSSLISTISNCSNSGRIENSNMLTGGIVGLSGQDKDLKTTITKCYNEGEIIVTNALCGGILGGGYANITQCYNKGNISGTTNVGGIAGSLGFTTNAATETELASNVEDCYNAGNIIATGWGVGIVCSVREVKMKNVYSIGNITASNTRPIIGIVQNSKDGTNKNNIDKAYHESKYNSDRGTIPKTLEELKDINLFDSNLWVIESGYDYPQLINNKHKN